MMNAIFDDAAVALSALVTCAIGVINNDPYLTVEEKLRKVASLKEEAGVIGPDDNGMYFVPTGVCG